jgi:putative nucleotidyltransferase with HDIG domain
LVDLGQAMSLEPTLEEQEQLADTLRRKADEMDSREVVVDSLWGFGFLAAVVGLWLLSPPRPFSVTPAVGCLLVFGVATLIHIDTPLGFTVPTQLAFVPLLFAVPLPLVPVAVAIALALSRVPYVIRGDLRPSRLLSAPGNAWFSVGPALMFAIAGIRPAAAGPALLIAALGAQFGLDFLLSGLRMCISRKAGMLAQLRETWVYVVDAGLSGLGLVIAKDIDSAPAAVLTLLPLLGVIAVFARERHQRLTGLLELNNAYHGTALVLGDVLEADDGYTGEHCRSVVELVMDVARELGLDAERRRNLEFGALLHDVGKIAIPKEIINKPGELDSDEWKIIRTHTIAGQKMLNRVGGFMTEVGRIVRSHHERWDGGGYPDGLVGEEIPLEARIISCCDAWNAMRTDRAYRNALSYDVALTELLCNNGTQFDPHVVAALLSVVGREAPARIARANGEPASARRALGAAPRRSEGSAVAGSLAG